MSNRREPDDRGESSPSPVHRHHHEVHQARPRRFRSLRSYGMAATNLGSLARAGIGSAAAIGGLATLAQYAHEPLLIAPLGASACLIFGLPESPFSQPRNTAIGHLIGALCGLGTLALLGNGPLAMGVAVGLAVVLMLATRSVHPPAGATALTVVFTDPGPGFLAMPLGVSVPLMIVVAMLVHRGTGARYPKQWW